jgi:antitoxin ParD1/3/4
MANVKERNISLTPDLDSVVERWIASGRYASRSEVIRAALRALEREEEERTGKPAAFAAESIRELEKGGPFYASLKIVEKLAAVLEVEPAELLRLPPRRQRRR